MKNYTPPAASSSLSNGAGSKVKESAGVSSGVAELAGFDAEAVGPVVDYSVNPKTGFSPERVTDCPDTSASKNGKSFEIC
jgi:hypothetical protein